jgi:hypothetical protein
MFSAALGLIGGIGSIIQAGYSYELGMEELALKRKALAQQKDFGMLQYGMARDQLAKENEQAQYIREVNERNAVAQSLERAKIEQQRKQRLAAYQAEREYVVGRQMDMDRAAAEQYALELEAYLSNKDIAKEERDTALQYLETARSIASGERQDDLSRLYLERVTAQQERDFAIAEMRNAQSIAQSERVQDMNYRDQIIGQLGEMQSQISSAYQGFDPITPPAGMSEAEMNQVYIDFDANAVANVDRAADRVASQSEAQLIDRGIERSTPGESARAQITRQLALDYENARQSARQQALDYIGGRQQISNNEFNNQLSARGGMMQEIQNMYAPTIQALTQLRPTQSANDYSAPVGVGSGNVIRGVSSANDFGAPLNVGSSAIAPNGMSSRMGQTLNAPSVADAFVVTGDYNQQSPQMWNITSPQGFMSNASSLIGSIAQQYNPQPWITRGDNLQSSGFAAIGGALNDMNRSGSFGQRTMANGQPAYATLPQYGPLPSARPANSYYHR